MYETVAWALACQDGQFERIGIQRGLAGPEDVTFDVKYCGVCHRQLFTGVPTILLYVQEVVTLQKKYLIN